MLSLRGTLEEELETLHDPWLAPHSMGSRMQISETRRVAQSQRRVIKACLKTIPAL